MNWVTTISDFVEFQTPTFSNLGSTFTTTN